jgi:hypothetical protein
MDAPLESVFRFASSTYFGYDRHGGVQRLGALANATAAAWTKSGELPHDLAMLRAALFFEARRWHHLGDVPDLQAETYIRALLDRLGQLSGGYLRPDHAGPIMRLRRVVNRWREPSE